jgi:hypothetical protein
VQGLGSVCSTEKTREDEKRKKNIEFIDSYNPKSGDGSGMA